MKLSILICTTPCRKPLFERVYNELLRQSFNKPVEILVDDSPKGSITIGAKSQRLLKRAEGEYICRVDSDDMVSGDYISQILKAIESGPDCIGFEIDCDMEGKKEKAISSLKYKEWAENKDGYKYVRSIYHKTPVKREIALRVGFEDKSYAEDHAYSMGIQPFLKSEIFIQKPLYFYNYKYENPKTKYGI
jgi:glycosyltransferase involved in cell wall biosynthesis